jgi:DNA (cytosine-5)-methyltransferase 1
MEQKPEDLIGDHTAVSLFSGCGGLDLGAAQAGFRILGSVEIDQHAVATLDSWTSRLPYSHRTYHQDILQVEPVQLMAELGLMPGQLDLLIGGPPCQSFSGIGFRRGLDDARGLLLFEMARFAEALRPRAILVEQVKGLINFTDSSGQRVLEVFRDQLHQLGYTTTWSLLNAADYGVPQRRERVLIVALKDTVPFAFPVPTHSTKATETLFGQVPGHRTVADVLQELDAPVRRGEIADDPNHVDVTPQRDQDRIRQVPEGEWLSAQLHLPAELRGNLTRKDTTKYRRLDRNSPSLTLRCGEIHYHPIENRYLTPREYLRIHGYPDWFELVGPIRSRSGRVKDLDQHRQVANSVPPPLAEAVAGGIRVALGRKADADSSRVAGLRDHRPIDDSSSESPSVPVPVLGAGVHGW